MGDFSEKVRRFCDANNLNPAELDETIIDALDDGEAVYLCDKCNQACLSEDIRECPKCHRMLCKDCFGGFYDDEECSDCLEAY